MNIYNLIEKLEQSGCSHDPIFYKGKEYELIPFLDFMEEVDLSKVYIRYLNKNRKWVNSNIKGFLNDRAIN